MFFHGAESKGETFAERVARGYVSPRLGHGKEPAVGMESAAFWRLGAPTQRGSRTDSRTLGVSGAGRLCARSHVSPASPGLSAVGRMPPLLGLRDADK